MRFLRTFCIVHKFTASHRNELPVCKFVFESCDLLFGVSTLY